MPDIDIARLQAGDRRALARAITLCESRNSQDRDRAQQLLDRVMPLTGNSIRIGVSGAPGVGKSTFIEAFGLDWISRGRKVAVLAVDPSSPLAGGSILGDKTRMEVLARAHDAFIRPSPNHGCLGGVGEHTREAILLCEAAGFNIIIVETVGVGQSELDVARMVDCFVLLLLGNAGDELQGIKRGILELAHLLVINKCDGDNREQALVAQSNYRTALNLLPHTTQWRPEVLTCSALLGEQISAIGEYVECFISQARQQGWLQSQRKAQSGQWMRALLQRMLQDSLDRHPQHLAEMQQAVVDGRCSPQSAARQLLNLLQQP